MTTNVSTASSTTYVGLPIRLDKCQKCLAGAKSPPVRWCQICEFMIVAILNDFGRRLNNKSFDFTLKQQFLFLVNCYKGYWSSEFRSQNHPPGHHHPTPTTRVRVVRAYWFLSRNRNSRALFLLISNSRKWRRKFIHLDLAKYKSSARFSFVNCPAAKNP